MGLILINFIRAVCVTSMRSNMEPSEPYQRLFEERKTKEMFLEVVTIKRQNLTSILSIRFVQLSKHIPRRL